MAEETYNPADHTVQEVNDHLATLDPEGDEYARVLQAERDGEARVGIVGKPEPETADNSNTLENSVGSGTVHQDGAPAELVEAAEEAQERGYLGDATEKPDYSQANPDVMNGTA